MGFRLKRGLSLIIALSMMLTMVPQTVFASERTMDAVESEATAIADEATDFENDTDDITNEFSDESEEEMTVSDDRVDEAADTESAPDGSGNFDVTLDANGGYFGNWEADPTATTLTVTATEGVVAVDTRSPESSVYPLHTGTKAFDGWYMDEDCTIPASMGDIYNSYTVSEGTILYAGYADAWVVTFDCCGGYYRTPSINKIEYKVKKGEHLKNGIYGEYFFPKGSNLKNDSEYKGKSTFFPAGIVTVMNQGGNTALMTDTQKGNYIITNPTVMLLFMQIGRFPAKSHCLRMEDISIWIERAQW